LVLAGAKTDVGAATPLLQQLARASSILFLMVPSKMVSMMASLSSPTARFQAEGFQPMISAGDDWAEVAGSTSFSFFHPPAKQLRRRPARVTCW
jgi:hypothetical protein